MSEIRNKEYIMNDKSDGFVTSSFNLVWLNIKFLLNNFKVLWQMLIFIIIGIVIPVIFIPITASMAVSILSYLILPSLLVMGCIGYEMKESSLYKNLIISGYKKREFYLSTFITILIVGLVLTTIFWPIISILGKAGYLMTGWRNSNRYSINLVSWFVLMNLVYIIIIESIVSFSFYFMFHSIINSSKAYYTIILSIFILGIIFGGSLNTYFGHPKGIMDYVTYDDEITFFYNGHKYWVPLYKSYDYYSLSQINGDSIYGQNFGGGIFPSFMFIPTMFFPFFGVGQFSSVSLGSIAVFKDYQYTYALVTPEKFDTLNHVQIINYITKQGITSVQGLEAEGFKLLNAYPNGINVSHIYSISFDKEHWYWTMVLIQPYLISLLFFFIGRGFILFKEM